MPNGPRLNFDVTRTNSEVDEGCIQAKLGTIKASSRSAGSVERLPLASQVAVAGSHDDAGAFDADFDLAPLPFERLILWIVRQRINAAKLLGDLPEGIRST